MAQVQRNAGSWSFDRRSSRGETGALRTALVLALMAIPLALPARLDAQDRPSEQIRNILEGGASGDHLSGAPLGNQEARKSDPEAIAIVNQYLKAIGGKETLEAIEDKVTRFRNVKFDVAGETEVTISLYLKQGYKYREEWDIKGLSIGEHKLAFVQIYNGDVNEGWVSMFNTVSPLEGRTLSVFVWDKHLDDFFMHWKDDGYTLHMEGSDVVEDEPVDVISVVDFTGHQRVKHFFSRSSGLLLKKEWTDTSQSKVATKEQFFRDYKRIKFSDGSDRAILFPLRVEIVVEGDLELERSYVEVKFNTSLDDALFAKPEGVPFDQRNAGGGIPSLAPTGGTEDGGSLRRPEGSATRRRAPIRRAHGSSGDTE